MLEAFLTFFHRKGMILVICYALRIFETSEILEKGFSPSNAELWKMMEALIFLNWEVCHFLEK